MRSVGRGVIVFFKHIVLLSLILPDLGALTSWLDTVSPDQYVNIVDLEDGKFEVFWEGDVEGIINPAVVIHK